MLPIALSQEVELALKANRPVVALETAVVTHGLPNGLGLEATHRMETRVRQGGAIPAFCGVYQGRLYAGLDAACLEHMTKMKAKKAAPRDLPGLVLAHGTAGTTVAATAYMAARAGIRVMATGGLGGIHHGPGLDVSADLLELTRRQVVVVCSGIKAVLDVEATAEALEALGVPVAGYGCAELPAFYCSQSGIPLEHTVNSPREAAEFAAISWELLGERAVVVAVPPPPGTSLDWTTISRGLDVTNSGRMGKSATPALLSALHHHTGGVTTKSNIALLVNNAGIAADIALALHTLL
ncbi:MAG: pseudouridine-5'-phosphate glycosidase [Bacillota bacterium]